MSRILLFLQLANNLLHKNVNLVVTGQDKLSDRLNYSSWATFIGKQKLVIELTLSAVVNCIVLNRTSNPRQRPISRKEIRLEFHSAHIGVPGESLSLSISVSPTGSGPTI